MSRQFSKTIVALLIAATPSAAAAHVGSAPRAMVASVDPTATDAGVAALAAGGNAVDAAVATALTLGVVNGHHSGIGGGCFMLLRTADGHLYALDGREQAPAKATADMFIRDGKGDTTLSQNGPSPAASPARSPCTPTPSNTSAPQEAGRPAPARGRPGRAGLPRRPRRGRPHRPRGGPVMAKLPRHGRRVPARRQAPLAEGDTIRQPDLARTYRAIADAGGPDSFYKGPFAKAVGDWMAANGGVLTADDFAAYQMKLRDPLVTTYRGYTIVGFPPPSSGGVHVAQILNILQNFDVGDLHKRDPALRVHVMAEAMKLAFADRAFFLGDPDAVHVPRGLADPAYGKALAARIKLDATLPNINHGTPPGGPDDFFGKHTTHIAAADADGNWVGITATVNTWFGSKVIVPGTGVILNDQMDDFAIQPGVPNAFGLVGSAANAPGPGKRPLSSMSPTIVLRGWQAADDRRRRRRADDHHAVAAGREQRDRPRRRPGHGAGAAAVPPPVVAGHADGGEDVCPRPYWTELDEARPPAQADRAGGRVQRRDAVAGRVVRRRGRAARCRRGRRGLKGDESEPQMNTDGTQRQK